MLKERAAASDGLGDVVEYSIKRLLLPMKLRENVPVTPQMEMLKPTQGFILLLVRPIGPAMVSTWALSLFP